MPEPPTHADYVHAAATLWGDAGVFAYETFDRFNADYFGGTIPPLPIVVGITAFGHCLALTRGRLEPGSLPRISLASNIFAPTQHGLAQRRVVRHGVNVVRDTLLHEMIHAKLMLDGLDADHNGAPWCAELERLSPLVLGRSVRAAPVKQRRVDGGRTREPLDGFLSRQELARWPQCLRPTDYPRGRPIRVDTY